jgi:hypothetical protein
MLLPERNGQLKGVFRSQLSQLIAAWARTDHLNKQNNNGCGDHSCS